MSGAEPLLRLDASVRQLRGPGEEAVLLGGSPLRVLRLRPVAKTIVDALSVGATAEEALGAMSGGRRESARRFLDALVARGLVHPHPVVDPRRSLVDLTLVIPVYNRATALARLLQSLGPLGERGLRVVVVDDGSTDGSGEVARQTGATVLRNDRSVGPAAARNTGADAASTTLLAFLDSDVVPQDGWLDLCLAHLDLGGSMRVDLVAPRVVGLAHDDASVIERYEASRSPLDLGPEPSLIAPLTKVAYVPAAALVMRTEVFRSVIGFDTTLHVGEDVDLLWRLGQKGAVLRYEPTAEVAHDHRSEFAPMVRRRMQYGTSAAPLDQRHPGLVAPAVLSPWSLAVWVLAFSHPLGVIAGAAVAFGTAEKLTKRLPQLSPNDARRLALRGHVAAGKQIVDASTRAWLPAMLLCSLVSHRCRMVLLTGIIGQGWREYRGADRRISLPAFLLIRACDNAAYGVGVWLGSLRTRTIGALLPKIVNWPGQNKTEEDAMS